MPKLSSYGITKSSEDSDWIPALAPVRWGFFFKCIYECI
ncbi:hypothetical protein [Klebsiella phage GADU21]|nr:hypothetical protein [Klebsiella phage GADU21]